jgi:putative SOS response-associated peptidase YedK
MCGRYTNDAELSDIRLAFGVEQLELYRAFTPTFNITPNYGPGGEQPFVVETQAGKRALRLGRFWLIPAGWNKPLKELPTAFNARAEELARRPLWKGAFESRRCLVPATGWREFQGKAGNKHAFHFHLDRRLFAFAGLYSTWIAPEGEAVDTFAIVTTEPSPLARSVHDRMPLVITPEHYADWLGASDPERVLALARNESFTLPLEMYESDPVGNSGRYEGPRVLDRAPVDARPASVQGELFGAASAEQARIPRARPRATK